MRICLAVLLSSPPPPQKYSFQEREIRACDEPLSVVVGRGRVLHAGSWTLQASRLQMGPEFPLRAFPSTYLSATQCG